MRSHPVWVCGLKHNYKLFKIKQNNVTPCMGVWIETGKQGDEKLTH